MDKIQEQIQYWINYTGHGDNYRKKNDRDCILTQGNLYADTLISLWLPLRYVIFECNKEKESFDSSEISKKDKKFLESLKDNLTEYIPDEKAIEKLNTLFDLGMTRANVIILPYRRWNSIRGGSPYWDYMPHFLYDLLNVQDERFEVAVKSWIRGFISAYSWMTILIPMNVLQSRIFL